MIVCQRLSRNPPRQLEGALQAQQAALMACLTRLQDARSVSSTRGRQLAIATTLSSSLKIDMNRFRDETPVNRPFKNQMNKSKPCLVRASFAPTRNYRMSIFEKLQSRGVKLLKPITISVKAENGETATIQTDSQSWSVLTDPKLQCIAVLTATKTAKMNRKDDMASGGQKTAKSEVLAADFAREILADDAYGACPPEFRSPNHVIALKAKLAQQEREENVQLTKTSNRLAESAVESLEASRTESAELVDA